MKRNKLKLAVAVFGSRISPRFDCAPIMLVVEKEEAGFSKKQEINTTGWTALERIKSLGQLEINILICGGIDEHSLQTIAANNIKIYSWITGEYEDALSCFLTGKLASGNMMGPGGIFRGKWRFRRRQLDFDRGGGRCRIKTGKGRGGSRDQN